MVKREIAVIPVKFPEKAVFFRLGGNRHSTVLTPEENAEFSRTGRRAFETCRCHGCYCVVKISAVRQNGIALENGLFLPGGDFALKSRGATHLWCGAVTVGSNFAREMAGLDNVTEKSIWDAVGSETADEAMKFLHQLATQELRKSGMSLSARRYSCGYGDMPLQSQQLIYDLLNLQDLGITLTENCFMLPEKSVTAWAAVVSTQESKNDA